jgi:hypothetical protein
LLTLALIIAAVQSAPVTIAPAAVTPTPRPPEIDYAQEVNWLCRPSRKDACAINLDATVIAPNGTTRVERFVPASEPAADCFYVYPTASADEAPNSDMIANAEEKAVIASQFARFASVCRTFAPLYRQVTLSALRAAMTGQPTTADFALGYRDVRAAFRDYLKRDNVGRPFVLIGHSQGSRILTQLVREEIDGKRLSSRMLSAMLIGSNVSVPPGRDVGGDFKWVPLCRSASQVGCAISYVSFRAEAPPPANTRFGKAADPALRAACVNPAAPAGGAMAPLDAYLGTKGAGFSSKPPGPWVKDRPAPVTAFVKTPGLLSGRCVATAAGDYLAISVNAVPTDPRTDTVTGDVVVMGRTLTDWGMHLIDVSAAQGDLIGLVRSQSAAWRRR